MYPDSTLRRVADPYKFTALLIINLISRWTSELQHHNDWTSRTLNLTTLRRPLPIHAAPLWTPSGHPT